MSYKIVDSFNGWEDTETYTSIDDAESACDEMTAKFLKDNGHRAGNLTNPSCSYTVVDAPEEWGWNQRSNRYEWS